MFSFRRWIRRLSSAAPARSHRRHSGPALACESLEGRDMMSATPLPVLLVVADQQDFYYREYSETRAGIEGKGVAVVVAATTTNPTTPHWNTGQPEGTAGTIVPDVALANVDASDYSAIAFVGGWGASMYQYAYNDPNGDGVTDNYYSNPLYNADSDLNDGVIAPQKVVVNDLIGEFLTADKPVAGICHGVTVLAWARVDGSSLLAGKQVAVPHQEGTPDQFYDDAWRNGGYYSGQRDQVLANGGIPTAYSGAYGKPGTADDVIVDGRVITGENPNSATLFGVTIGNEVLANVPIVVEPPANQPPTAQDSDWLLVENSPAGTVVGTIAASDPEAGQLTYAIASGNTGGAFSLDSVTGQLTVANPAALDFETTPSLALTCSITDPEGLSAFATVTIHLQDAAESPVSVVNGDLVVTGTSAGDTVYLWSGAGNQTFAWLNGESYGPFALPAGGRVIVSGEAGNDQIFATDLAIPVSAYGGAGHDLMTGGSAGDLLDGGDGVDRVWGNACDDVLIGGAGNDFLDGHLGNDILVGGDDHDTLNGGDGRDLLIGGLGEDLLRGGNDDDALFGFSTAYDNDISSLAILRSGWLGAGTIDERIELLTAPEDVGIRVGDTAHDDGSADTLVGGEGNDFGLAALGDAVYLTPGNDRLRTM